MCQKNDDFNFLFSHLQAQSCLSTTGSWAASICRPNVCAQQVPTTHLFSTTATCHTHEHNFMCIAKTLDFAGSVGTAVDTQRDEHPSTAAALHHLSRPKTIRHRLTPQIARSCSPSPLYRAESVSTHANGSINSHSNADFAALARKDPSMNAHGTHNAKVRSQGSMKNSIETKGDR